MEEGGGRGGGGGGENITQSLPNAAQIHANFCSNLFTQRTIENIFAHSTHAILHEHVEILTQSVPNAARIHANFSSNLFKCIIQRRKCMHLRCVGMCYAMLTQSLPSAARIHANFSSNLFLMKLRDVVILVLSIWRSNEMSLTHTAHSTQHTAV
jgi:hypothetical protein